MDEDILQFLNEKKVLLDSIIKTYLPETIDENYVNWAFGRPTRKFDLEAINKTIAEPLWDFINRGGKRWRPALFFLVAEALGGDLEKIKDFAIVPELAHEGSIIVDDIEDMGETRRGKPCTHKIFGVDIAINAGNMMYFIPLLVFTRNRDKIDPKILIRAYQVYSQEMINIHIGQGIDIWWHKGKKEDITEEEYLQMCAYKTGTLARMAAKLAVVLSGGSEEQEKKIGNVAESIGVAFQIQDDILSATGEEFAKNKGYGDDITEGKRTLMVIHTLENASEEDKKKLLSILNAHTRDPNEIAEAINILKKHGSVDYAKSVSKEIMKKAWTEADPLIPDSEAKEKLKKLAYFLIERNI